MLQERILESGGGFLSFTFGYASPCFAISEVINRHENLKSKTQHILVLNKR